MHDHLPGAKWGPRSAFSEKIKTFSVDHQRARALAHISSAPFCASAVVVAVYSRIGGRVMRRRGSHPRFVREIGSNERSTPNLACSFFWCWSIASANIWLASGSRQSALHRSAAANAKLFASANAWSMTASAKQIDFSPLLRSLTETLGSFSITSAAFSLVFTTGCRYLDVNVVSYYWHIPEWRPRDTRTAPACLLIESNEIAERCP